MVKNDRRCWFYHEFLRDCVVHRKVGRGIVRGIAALGILGITRSGETGLVILNITERLTLTRVWETNINKHAYMNLHYNHYKVTTVWSAGRKLLSNPDWWFFEKTPHLHQRSPHGESSSSSEAHLMLVPPLHLKCKRSKNLHSFKNMTAQHKTQTKDV